MYFKYVLLYNSMQVVVPSAKDLTKYGYVQASLNQVLNGVCNNY